MCRNAHRDVFDLEWRLSEGEEAQIAARTGLSSRNVQGMSFDELIPEARMMIRRNWYHCPQGAANGQSKTASLTWVFRFSIHATVLQDTTDATLNEVLGTGEMAMLGRPAKTGAAVLDAWARGEELRDLGPVEMLTLLTTRHRRASPPSANEQPRMSLQTCRDYHAFLTTPISRQALKVVVPEYDEVAPVLAKPVRPGLHGLTQGSLLPAFALTVGIGRVAEDPVDQASSILLKSDVDGQARVREALRLWPLSLRRRISARLWRTQRDERERQVRRKAHETAPVSQILLQNLMNPGSYLIEMLEFHEFRSSDNACGWMPHMVHALICDAR